MQTIENHPLTGKDAGNYHIDRLLGQGPFSHFYEAHSLSGQRVMLTAFSLPETSSQQAQASFLTHFMQEGTALTRLKHPAIIPIFAYGECDSYPYLVTPLVPGSSLAQILRSQGRLSVEAVLAVLRQVADGLDYAHRNGILHGSLSAANIVQGSEGTVQIAGFGFMHILARQHLEQDSHSNTQGLHTTKLFAGVPARMAPEIVAAALGQNAPFDARVDTYALGILLFELISGHLPFTATTPLEVAQQQAQPIPRLAALYPMLPASIDTVLQKALAYQPEQRFQSAGELMYTFEQALNGPSAQANKLVTLVHNTPAPSPGSNQTPQQSNIPAFDPFVWWANVSPMQTVPHPKTVKAAVSTAQKGERHTQDRRKVVALLTASSVVAIVGFGGGTIALSHILHSHSGQTQTASIQPHQPVPVAKAPTHTTQPQKPAPTHTTQPQKSAPTAKPQIPTAAPTPVPQPQHTGTVIGSTSIATNTAQSFSNGTNLLIHLPNGNFVAYNRACTHVGVPVDYDPGSQQLVCPAHGAVFDPANNANPVSGPANGPLSAVTIHVNGDGTITAS
jgi:serine/threonine protein kinase